MFGLLQGASCGLSNEGRQTWWQHICGVCLALHSSVGQVGRVTTNYDSALLSLLYSQQLDKPSETKVHSCLLRKPIKATPIAPHTIGTQFGAAMALIMAATKLNDQLVDGDIRQLSPMRLPAKAMASKWAKQGTALATKLKFRCTTAVSIGTITSCY